MRRRRRHIIDQPYADPELQHEAEVLRVAIKTAIKELDLATLRTLLRVIRYAEEGKTPVAVAQEGLQDKFQRKINLDAYIDKEKQ